MRRPLLAATVIFACWLGLPSPANAQQAPDSHADLILVGAPLAASASPTSAHGPTVVAISDRRIANPLSHHRRLSRSGSSSVVMWGIACDQGVIGRSDEAPRKVRTVIDRSELSQIGPNLDMMPKRCRR